ncbi:HEPN domain-containing protein [Verrucosispora sp. NA02020]|uniref:HEPN domain-containing protein n=1 Tax=Verrucosispora sp. NA02020 TaxID=2742132 RepID=UPI0015913773|nr:HEPN domain-containing protein [Verrucosispora sp. NA02020]QKW15743.1 hypothetical protein HUT12_25230 [Verrucosispora sp. NA02020]
MPAAELALFKKNLSYARDLVSTAIALSAQLTAAINTDDLLRSALVQGVSALDHFVHEEVRARMLLTEQELHAPAKGYERFRVRMSSVRIALSQPGISWLDAEIREQHGYLSFQNPDKIAEVYKLISDVPIWQEVAKHLGESPDSVKRRLKLIVDRRNKIVHEADTDPTIPPTRYPINDQLVSDSLDFLESVVDALGAVAV